jgi:hypothetical protein
MSTLRSPVVVLPREDMNFGFRSVMMREVEKRNKRKKRKKWKMKEKATWIPSWASCCHHTPNLVSSEALGEVLVPMSALGLDIVGNVVAYPPLCRGSK